MKKYVICIPSSTDFALSTAILIYSLKKNLKVYNECDIKVQYNDLDEASKNLIKKVKNDVIFEKPKDSSFYHHISETIYGSNNYDCYLSFEMFWQDGYQKSIYLDSDMLCVKDFSKIILENKGGITWKVPNLGTVIVGEKILGKDTYYKFINTALNHYKNDPMGDQNTLIHLYSKGEDVTTIGDEYNFQHWGGGGKGSNQNFLNNEDNIKIIHYSGRRKPWGGVYGGVDHNNKNCMSYPYMCYHSKAIKLWFKYYEEFKINYLEPNTPFGRYQLTNKTIIKDNINGTGVSLS